MKQYVLGVLVLAAACGKSDPATGGAPGDPAKGGAAAPAAPSIRAEAAVYKPTFTTKGGDLEAGTAFVARLAPGGPPFLFTAHHLFGALGGLDREYTWQELPAFVIGVAAVPVEKGVPLRGGAALPINGAIAFTQEHMGGDVAVFAVTDPLDAPALTFAATPPAEGAEVWLIAKLDGAAADKLRYRGVVKVVDGGAIAFAFDDKGLALRASSGAPIVNKAGEVVGINLASGEMEGKTIGMGASADAVTKLVGAAVKR